MKTLKVIAAIIVVAAVLAMISYAQTQKEKGWKSYQVPLKGK